MLKSLYIIIIVHKILILYIWTLIIIMYWSCNLHDILN